MRGESAGGFFRAWHTIQEEFVRLFVGAEHQIRDRDTEESGHVQVATIVRVMGLMESVRLAPHSAEYPAIQFWLPPGTVWLVMRDVDRFVQEQGDSNGGVPANENRDLWK